MIRSRKFSVIFGIYSAIITLAYIIFLVINRDYALEIGLELADGLISSITLAFLGVLLSYRRPENRISWLLVLIALMRQTSFLFNSINILSLKGMELSYWLLLGNFWPTLSGLTYTILAYVIVLFPTGRLPSPRWRPVSLLITLQTLLTASLFLFLTIDLAQSISNIRAIGGEIVVIPVVPSGPFTLIKHVREIPEVAYVGFIIAFIAFIIVLLGLFSQVSQYRTGSPIVRQQIKWVLFVVALWVVALLLVFLPLGIPFGWIILVSPLIPISIAVAILRYRLFDIDLIIQRTVLYIALTGLLAVIYFGSVTLLQSLFSAASGQESPVIIVISTLLIAALFTPLRRRVQYFIDRRFYRQKYDAKRTLAHFAHTVRDEVDLDAITADLTAIIHDTLQPASVSLWLHAGREDDN